MKLTDLIQEHRIATAPAGHHHNTNGWVNIDCPFCSKGSHRWRMGINLRGNYVSCWTCGSHRLSNTIAALLDIPLPQAIEMVGSLERSVMVPDEDQPKGTLKLPAKLGVGLFEVHRAFLQRRGFDPDEIERLWKIKGIGMGSGGMAWRIFIPIIYKGETVSWTSRSIKDNPKGIMNAHKSTMKYRTASADEEAIPAKHLLYGEDFCRHAVIVNEGPMDAWAVGPGAVATLGMAYSRPQLARIARFPVRVVAFDAEPAAQTRAKRLVRDLEAFPGETYCVTFTTGKDASRASKKEVAELRKRFLDD